MRIVQGVIIAARPLADARGSVRHCPAVGTCYSWLIQLKSPLVRLRRQGGQIPTPWQPFASRQGQVSKQSFVSRDRTQVWEDSKPPVTACAPVRARSQARLRPDGIFSKQIRYPSRVNFGISMLLQMSAPKSGSEIIWG